MKILDNFRETFNSDNRARFMSVDHTDELIIGGSCTHIFEFPFSYSHYVKSCSIVYKQGLNIVLDIPITPEMVKESLSGMFSSIIVKLTPLQTQLFNNTILDTFCQARLINIEDEVLFDEPHYLKIIAPLKEEHMVEEEN